MVCAADHIVPAVNEWTEHVGVYQVPRQLTVSASSQVFIGVAEYAVRELEALKFEATLQQSTVVAADLQFSEDPRCPEGGYQLAITDHGLVVSASGREGAFWGLQGVLQVLHAAEYAIDNPAQLARGIVVDLPRFPYRGMHLDVSRHFFSVADVKRYIDLLALHKFNYFHWHLSDDAGWRIEIKRFPDLTALGSKRSGTVLEFPLNPGARSDNVEYGGFYTQDEVKEVVRYASDRCITVVPEIDVPGHASAILAAYPELACAGHTSEVKAFFGIFPDVLCLKGATFDFLSGVFAELAKLFPGPYIHIGGDEVLTTRWSTCEACQDVMREANIHDVSQLQGVFTARACELVRGLGKQPIAWADVAHSEVDPMVVMPWWGKAQAEVAAEAGHTLIMAPVEHAYFDFYQSRSLDEPLAIHPQAINALTRLSDVYDFDPLAYIENEVTQSRVIGGQGNVWTEYIRTFSDIERMVLPRMSALAEVLWTPQSRRSWPDFLIRLSSLEEYLARKQYTFSNSHLKPYIEAVWRDGAFRVVMDSPADIVYTLDGTLPDADSDRYVEPLHLSKSARICAAALVDGCLIGEVRLSLEKHLGLDQVIHLNAAHGVDCEPEAQNLINGVLAHDRLFEFTQWTRFEGVDMDATIQFDEPTVVSSIRLGFDATGHRRLHRPSAFSIFAGTVRDDSELLIRIDKEEILDAGGALECVISPAEVDSLRVVAHNDDVAWCVSSEAMVPTTIFIDEIVVH